MTTQTAPARADHRPPFLRRNAWPLGYLAAAIVVFVFYYTIVLGYFDSSFVSSVNDWLPLTTINEALVWVMCALGLNIVVGYAGLLDLGFVAFWAIGGYVAGWFMSSFFDKANFNFFGNAPTYTVGGVHLNFWLVIGLGAAICAFFGVLIGAPTLRLRSDYLALVTLGFGEIIPQVLHNGDDINGFNLSNGTKGIQPVDQVKSLSFTRDGVGWRAIGTFDNLSMYLILVLLTVLIIFISLRLREGRLGRAWLAIREDELAASSMGVPLMRTKLAAYAVGAVAGGVAGVAFAVNLSSVLPDRFQFSISITLLAMVVLGGMGNVWGVMLGALVLAWFNATGLKQTGNSFNSFFGTHIDFTSYSFLIFGGVLVLMMLFRREGLLPEARTRLVLREPGRTEAEALGADMEAPAPELDEAVDAVEAEDSVAPAEVADIPIQSIPTQPTAEENR
jgi:branched-chain amino acid transport system permease protein